MKWQIQPDNGLKLAEAFRLIGERIKIQPDLPDVVTTVTPVENDSFFETFFAKHHSQNAPVFTAWGFDGKPFLSEEIIEELKKKYPEEISYRQHVMGVFQLNPDQEVNQNDNP